MRQDTTVPPTPGGLPAALLQALDATATPGCRPAPTRVFRTRDELQKAVDSAPHTMAPWAGEEGPRWRITVAGGGIRIGTKDYAAQQRSEERALQRRIRENDAMREAGDSDDATPATKTTRRPTTGWTRDSRARMVSRLCTLDYAPLFAGQHPPALVTLTMPHDWERLAPTARDFKTIVQRWQNAWRSKWGAAPIAVWKMEFQYRIACAREGCHDPRAPHLHLLMRLPDAELRDFMSWLSRSWTQAMRPSKEPDRGEHIERAGFRCSCSEWCRSLAAGTAVDFEETLRYGDAKRVAVYFLKHGVFEAKEYQNTMPAAWDAARNGGANFWGYWGLEVVQAVLETDPELAAFAARCLRGVNRSERYGVKVQHVRVSGIPGVATIVRTAKKDHPAGRPILVELEEPIRVEKPRTETDAVTGVRRTVIVSRWEKHIWCAENAVTRLSDAVEHDPHQRRALGRSTAVWRSKKLPADLAALDDNVLRALVAVASADKAPNTPGAAAVQQTPIEPISAIMSASVSVRDSFDPRAPPTPSASERPLRTRHPQDVSPPERRAARDP